jgi:hypothetical protein
MANNAHAHIEYVDAGHLSMLPHPAKAAASSTTQFTPSTDVDPKFPARAVERIASACVRDPPRQVLRQASRAIGRPPRSRPQGSPWRSRRLVVASHHFDGGGTGSCPLVVSASVTPVCFRREWQIISVKTSPGSHISPVTGGTKQRQSEMRPVTAAPTLD